MTNQEALNIVNNFVEWNNNETLLVKYPFGYDYKKVVECVDKLQEAMHELDITNKALELAITDLSGYKPSEHEARVNLKETYIDYVKKGIKFDW